MIRKKHSHRCTSCDSAVYCYKGGCQIPQRIARCKWCPAPLPGLAPALAEQAAAAAVQRGEELTTKLLQPIADTSKAAGHLESHSPLFRGSAADPQFSLF